LEAASNPHWYWYLVRAAREEGGGRRKGKGQGKNKELTETTREGKSGAVVLECFAIGLWAA